jgi:hypothetical protein
MLTTPFGHDPEGWIARRTSLSLKTVLVSGLLLAYGYPQSVITSCSTPGVQVNTPLLPPTLPPFVPPAPEPALPMGPVMPPAPGPPGPPRPAVPGVPPPVPGELLPQLTADAASTAKSTFPT